MMEMVVSMWNRLFNKHWEGKRKDSSLRKKLLAVFSRIKKRKLRRQGKGLIISFRICQKYINYK